MEPFLPLIYDIPKAQLMRIQHARHPKDFRLMLSKMLSK
jgi:hypothetical protein